jgi:hypothetical protein
VFSNAVQDSGFDPLSASGGSRAIHAIETKGNPATDERPALTVAPELAK